jgi:hypothetical protein
MKTQSGDMLQVVKSLAVDTGKPKQVWIEAWYVREKNNAVSWRAEVSEQPNELHKKIALWRTHFLFPGQKVIVSFYSRHGISRANALIICEEIISGKVRLETLDLREI